MGHPANIMKRALIQLRSYALEHNVPHPHYGVCGNLRIVLSMGKGLCVGYLDAYQWVPAHSTEWEHAEWCYPSPDELPRLKDYFVPNTPGFGMWEGPNLERRIELIDHLIEQCDAELGVPPALAG